MMTITVCVGSSCHLQGARRVIERFNELLVRHGLTDKVALKGSFCMERCGAGVNWQIDEELITSTNAEAAVEAFCRKVLAPMGIPDAARPEGTQA
jgi:NADH:ubiquinone oxidoreductase subunit E